MSDRILILHGALGSSHQFTPLLNAIADAEVMEFMGHGDAADGGDPWTMDLFVDQLERYLDTNEWSCARVFGYSMGGYVALQLAKKKPHLIGRVLTLGTKLLWTPQGAEHETRLLDPDTIQAKVPAFAADLGRRHGADRWRSVLQKTSMMMMELGGWPRLLTETMSEVSCPVRYMVGDADEMVSLEETRSFQRATPGAELAVLPGTRHPIEKVRLEHLLYHISDFLRK